MANRWGKNGNGGRIYFLGLQSHCRWWLQPWNKRHLFLGRKAMTNLDCFKKQRHLFSDEGLSSQSYGFSSSRVQMWELDHKEDWVLKNWCFRAVVREDSWDSLGQQGIKPVNPKGNELLIFTGRTVAEAEAPILWPADANSWLIGKDPDAEKYWRQAEKGTTENEMVKRHHRLNGHEFEQTLGDSEGQGSLVCYSPWGLKELDTTKRLDNKIAFISLLRIPCTFCFDKHLS